MIKTLHGLSKKILPVWLYQRLIGNWDKEGLKKYFRNTNWMFAARGASFITSFLTIAIVARYLGPENLGKLSYAQSLVSILSVFAALGIDQVLYRDLAHEPERERELLGTAILTKFFFGTLAFIAAIILSISLNNEPLLTILIGITALTFLINPLGTIGILFQARVQAKYGSQITIFLAFLIPALKILVIVFDKGIIYFSAVLVAEAVITAIWYLYIYQTKFKGSPLAWHFSLPVFKNLFSRSWPLLLASLSGYIYGRIDQVMIQHMIDVTSVGFYDIAVRMTEFLSYIPGIIAISVLPAVIYAKKRSHAEYVSRFKYLIFLSISFSFFAALALFTLAPFIITTIFGNDYFASIAILRIYVWSTLGTVFLLLLQQYFIIENKSIQFLVYSLLGAVTNVILNLLLIPTYGMKGAAYATLLTMILLVVVFIFTRIISNKNLLSH